MHLHSNLFVISNYRALLGESPVWDSDSGVIYWVDIGSSKILGFNERTDKLKQIALKKSVGCIALCVNNDFVVALKDEIVIVDRIEGDIKEKIAAPEADEENNRSNDGKCDPVGRFWVGTKSLCDESGKGAVYMIDSSTCHKKIEAVTISNGMAWSPNAELFYYIDTITRRVVAYEYDRPTGAITNKRNVISINESDGYPDGMTIDTEGMLWIALWDGWKVARYNPFTGEMLCSINLPVSKVTSCVFGGANLTDLYVTSAREGLTDGELEQQPLAGSLFVVRDCGFKGLAAQRFNN